VLGTALVSCEKESAIRPKQDTSAAGARQTLNESTPILLTRRGSDDSFSYASPETAKITKVTHAANNYTVYIYFSSGRRIKTVDFNGENRMGETQYMINDAGRCTSSRQMLFVYDPAKGSFPSDSVIIYSYYSYDALGRLSSKQDVEDAIHGSPTNDYNQHHYYYFDKNNDLTEVKTFASGKLWLDALFDYGQLSNQPMITDRLQLNETNTFINDRYLKVFGASSTHLVRHTKILQYPFYSTTTPFIAQDYEFNYMLNRLGLVTQKQTVNVLNGQQLPTEYYAYQVFTGQ
jgi:hypothetical protein